MLFKNNERYHKNSIVQAKFSNSTGTFGKNVQKRNQITSYCTNTVYSTAVCYSVEGKAVCYSVEGKAVCYSVDDTAVCYSVEGMAVCYSVEGKAVCYSVKGMAVFTV